MHSFLLLVMPIVGMFVCVCVVFWVLSVPLCYFKSVCLSPHSRLLSALPAVSDRLQLLEQARLSNRACVPVIWPFRSISWGRRVDPSHQPRHPLAGQFYQEEMGEGTLFGVSRSLSAAEICFL